MLFLILPRHLGACDETRTHTGQTSHGLSTRCLLPIGLHKHSYSFLRFTNRMRVHAPRGNWAHAWVNSATIPEARRTLSYAISLHLHVTRTITLLLNSHRRHARMLGHVNAPAIFTSNPWFSDCSVSLVLLTNHWVDPQGNAPWSKTLSKNLRMIIYYLVILFYSCSQASLSGDRL